MKEIIERKLDSVETALVEEFMEVFDHAIREFVYQAIWHDDGNLEIKKENSNYNIHIRRQKRYTPKSEFDRLDIFINERATHTLIEIKKVRQLNTDVGIYDLSEDESIHFRTKETEMADYFDGVFSR